jgi:hypothetical protein
MKCFINSFGKTTVAIIIGLMLASVADAATVGDVAENIENNFSTIKSMIVSGGFVLGAILGVGGVYLIYKDTKQPGQDHLKKGMVSLIAGVLLLALPIVLDTANESVFGSGNNNSAGSTSLKASKAF